MKLTDLLNKSINLTNNQEDRHALYWLLLEVLEYSNEDYILNRNEIISSDIINKYETLVNKYLIDKIPVQYLVGHSYFYNRKFNVSSDTLIPRPETEELVYKTINYIKENFTNIKDLKILDLATGSGAIGITIKKELDCHVTISDLSIKALEIAKMNALKHNVNIEIINSNWFNNIKDQYDVIISNPPYIPSNDTLEDKVLKEPNMALFSGIKGIDSYTIILNNINNYLKEEAIIAFEHGINQNDLIRNLINSNLSDVTIKQEKDMSNKERFTFIIKTKKVV